MLLGSIYWRRCSCKCLIQRICDADKLVFAAHGIPILITFPGLNFGLSEPLLPLLAVSISRPTLDSYDIPVLCWERHQTL